MFSKEYTLKGSHATKMKQLVAKFPQSSNSFFRNNIDVFVLAPIVRVLYNRTSEFDKENDATKIFTDQFTSHYRDLIFSYRLVLLSIKKNKVSLEERVNRAFNGESRGTSEEDFKLFEKYLLGGIDVLYEKLIEQDNPTKEDDYLSNLNNFLNDIHERYESDEQSEQDFLQKLEQIARQ